MRPPGRPRYPRSVSDFDRAETARRAGVDEAYVGRLVELGILKPGSGDRFSSGDIRRARLVEAIENSGVPLEGLAEVLSRGEGTLAFMDDPTYERFSALSSETFAELSERTGIPMELLVVMRESVGSAQPEPHDLVREDEMRIVPSLELQVAESFNRIAIERMLRVTGESMRRIAEQEVEWWTSQVQAPLLARGVKLGDLGVATLDIASRMQVPLTEALDAIMRAQEAHAWQANIIESIEQVVAEAGLYSRVARPPAMCFLDITGYTRLTQERGDAAAAELADDLARLVKRASVQRGGRAIKWLGDGVMFHFPDPGLGVVAALDMVEGVVDAGLPPAHVGLHAGPVLLQEGDYYGQTVNIASRIAEYARPGEVLVSDTVVAAAEGAGAAFTEIGPVELKGVGGPLRLHSAHRAPA